MLENTKKIMILLLSIVALSVLFISCNKNNQKEVKKIEWPQKAVTLIVPYSPGGTTDLAARQFSIQLAKHLGQPVTIVNQAGASGSIGTKTVFDAKDDGYTLLFSADSLGTQRVMGLSELCYNDFTPIIVTVNDPKVIVVNKDSKYKTLTDLITDMRNRPGKVKMSYTGPGGSGHVQALIYNKFGMDMAITAYQGGSECLLAVLGKQVDFTNSNYSTVKSYIESGDLVLLGVSSNSRLEQHKDVPTVAEIIPESKEYMDIPFTPLSLLAKNTVPEEVINVLREASNKAVNEAEWIEYVKNNSLDKLYEKYPTVDSQKKFFSDWESLVSWLLFDAGATKNSPEKFGIKRPN